jgi:lamin tail-like protein
MRDPLPFEARAASDLSFAEGDLAPADPLDMAQAADLFFDLPRDLSRAPDLASGMDLAPPADLLQVACTIRINEVATGTTTSGLEEFVELYNPCDSALALAGHQLVYRAAAGASDVVLVADLQVTLAKNSFLVFSGDGYYASVRQATMTSGLAELGGGLAVRDPAGRILDSLGWGTATNAFVVGSPAPAPRDRAAPGRSVARSPDGSSHGDNAGDFAVTDQPTPGAANVLHCSGC